MKTKYKVSYGDCAGVTYYAYFTRWVEAARFIKHLLDEGTPVKSVEVV
jgi:hypothetical protein